MRNELKEEMSKATEDAKNDLYNMRNSIEDQMQEELLKYLSLEESEPFI